MKRLLMCVAVLTLMGACLGAGVAFAASPATVVVPAYWVPGDPSSGGKLIGYHYYTSYSNTKWKNTQMRFVVLQQVTRNSNDVSYYIYSDNSLAHSASYTTIAGNTWYNRYPNVITEKLRTGHAGTYSSWYVAVDLNNFPDPSAWGYTSAF